MSQVPFLPDELSPYLFHNYDCTCLLSCALQIGRAQTESGGKLIADAYGADWPVRLGRVDSTEAGPAGRVINLGAASTEEIKTFFKQLGKRLDRVLVYWSL